MYFFHWETGRKWERLRNKKARIGSQLKQVPSETLTKASTPKFTSLQVQPCRERDTKHVQGQVGL